jgi:hypothetical protein
MGATDHHLAALAPQGQAGGQAVTRRPAGGARGSRALRVALAAASVALTLAWPWPVAACSCVARAERAYLAGADAAFLGESTSIDAPAGAAGNARFSVVVVYRGDVPAEVTVRTPAGTGACGIEFVAGERYLVFARAQEGFLSTGICDGTTNDPAAPGRLGVEGSPPRPGAIAVALAASALAPAPASRAGPLSLAVTLLAATALGLAGVARRRPG